MSNTGPITEILTTKLDEVLTHGLGTPIVTLLGAAAVTAVAARFGTLRAFRQLAQGADVSRALNVSRTDYWPTGKVNPETGREFFRQDIIVVSETDLTNIFNTTIKGPIVKAIHEAEKLTTIDEPIVYQHLPKVVKPKRWHLMQDAILRLSRAHFSDMFNDAAGLANEEMGPRERPIYDLVLPLMVREPTSEKAKMRSKFILLPIKDGRLKPLPPIEDVLFFDEKSDRWEPHFVPGLDQPLANRHRLVKGIGEILDLPQNTWLRNLSVRVRTGKREHVPLPQELGLA